MKNNVIKICDLCDQHLPLHEMIQIRIKRFQVSLYLCPQCKLAWDKNKRISFTGNALKNLVRNKIKL